MNSTELPMAQVPKYADEAAFPQPHLKRLEFSERTDVVLPAQWGLTKRELFAAMAMQGFAARPSGDCYKSVSAAEDAVVWADALLKELGK